MRSKTILALAALNVILLMTLCFHNVLDSRADAQIAKVPPPSEYLMVSGEIQGGSAGVIFMIDTRNNLLSARTMSGKLMEDMQPVDLSHIFK